VVETYEVDGKALGEGHGEGEEGERSGVEGYREEGLTALGYVWDGVGGRRILGWSGTSVLWSAARSFQ
jgi:hypothetical protein